jgi:HK97 gp10 family phage protein
VKVTVRVEGLSDLDAALGQMKVSTAKGVLRRVGRAALQPFDEAWRPNAPVDPHADGPHLKDSGGVGSKLTRSQRKSRERESFVEIFAGPGGHPKAQQQEFGNARHPAQPFIRPAWDATKDRVLDLVRILLGAEIERTAARAAKRAARAAQRAAEG